jgi:hypothetical protein
MGAKLVFVTKIGAKTSFIPYFIFLWFDHGRPTHFFLHKFSFVQTFLFANKEVCESVEKQESNIAHGKRLKLLDFSISLADSRQNLLLFFFLQ